MSNGANPGENLLLTDSPADVKKKINKYAFSGGGITLEEHKKYGGKVEIDIPYQYLRFFLDDDAKLEEIRVQYSKGEMMTGEIKQQAIDCIGKVVTEYQDRRKKITDKEVDKVLQVRLIA